MEFFGEATKGEIRKYSLTRGISASSIVNVPGINMDEATCFIVDFDLMAAERFAIMPCFENRSYVFAYGHDLSQSRSSVTLLVFFGTLDNCDASWSVSSAIDSLIDFYDSNRISENGNRLQVQILSNGKFSTGALIGMQVRAYNADLNAATITFTFMSTDVP